MENIKELLIQGNKQYLDEINRYDFEKEKLEELSNGQNPFALVITCSDSRVVPEKIFSCLPGDLFIIRTAGNVINVGELATIEYAIDHLHIKYIVVLAHTHCGAVHAAIHNEQGKHLHHILDLIRKNIGGETSEVKASIMNGQKQVETIKEMFPNYQGEVETALYDIETGEVIF